MGLCAFTKNARGRSLWEVVALVLRQRAGRGFRRGLSGGLVGALVSLSEGFVSIGGKVHRGFFGSVIDD